MLFAGALQIEDFYHHHPSFAVCAPILGLTPMVSNPIALLREWYKSCISEESISVVMRRGQ
jgi:hypothetical protein